MNVLTFSTVKLKRDLTSEDSETSVKGRELHVDVIYT